MNRFNNVIFVQKTFVINENRQILIIKRRNNAVHQFVWDIPGGKLEDSDNLLDAMKRELKEETGLELVNIISILSSSKFEGVAEDKPLIFRNIYISKATGEVRLSEEHSEYKWINAGQISEYNFIVDKDFQNSLKILPEVLSILDLNKNYCILE